ncbi:hypothetical protein GCM10007939_22690 [Amylibacter marinus]|uniref:DnaA N-terminal domain-containing protein n=1 Tax=Amylibacter marinus TaxID=1475483 RepID=A0ABQ5VXA4_9RHOB|nr:DnaA N-terminal domain-containing protein [Amylibacter marinus]GLQ35985.1 hypothetical protein GCM10007939_22690 [Amylibacter marinus]
MLDMKKLTGPKAGSIKYDLLTAISIAGLAGSPSFQTSMTRLSAVLTARYNWRLDEFSVGQRDLARMWAVNERTVKREIKKLQDYEILVQKRAGRRGKVGAYRLNFAQIWKISKPYWQEVGPDYAERMASFVPDSSVKVVKVDFEGRTRAEPSGFVGGERNAEWRDVCAQLRQQDPDQFASWFARLQFQSKDGDVLRLAAPSAFVSRYIETHLQGRLYAAVQSVFPEITVIKIQH